MWLTFLVGVVLILATMPRWKCDRSPDSLQTFSALLKEYRMPRSNVPTNAAATSTLNRSFKNALKKCNNLFRVHIMGQLAEKPKLTARLSLALTKSWNKFNRLLFSKPRSDDKLERIVKSTSSVMISIVNSPLVLKITESIVAKIAWYVLLVQAMKLGRQLMAKLPGIGNTPKVSPNITKYLKPNCTLNANEREILSTVVLPQSIDKKFEDIGGHFALKQTLGSMLKMNEWSNKNKNRTNSNSKNPLYSPVRSILFYGPPGCGKYAALHLVLLLHSIYIHFASTIYACTYFRQIYVGEIAV